MSVPFNIAAMINDLVKSLVDSEPEFTGADYLSHTAADIQFRWKEHKAGIGCIPQGEFTLEPWKYALLVCQQ